MKKIALMLAMALLAACGGSGGSGTNVGGNNSTGITPTGITPSLNGATGTLSVNIESPSAKQLAFSLNSTSARAVLTTQTIRRVVITNPALKNSAGKIVQFRFRDYDITETPAPSISIPNIPIGDGYTIEVIEFERTQTGDGPYYQATTTRFNPPHIAPDNTFKNWSVSYNLVAAGSRTDVAPIKILKYDAKFFNMTKTQSVNIGLKSLSGQSTISRGDNRYGGAIPSNSNALFNTLSTQYKMKATFSTTSSAHVMLSPFRDTWTLKQSYATDLSGATSTQIAGTITDELTGPSAYNATNAYQNKYYSAGVFYLKDTLVLPGEKATDFQFTSNTLTNDLYARMGTLGAP